MKFKPILIILIILLPLIIFMDSFKFLLFSSGFYSEEFSKYGVYEIYPDADRINTNLQSYFQSKAELNEGVFSEIEIIHLNDVKNLVSVFMALLKIFTFIFILLMIILIFFTRRQFLQKFSKVLFLGSLLSIALLIIFSLALLSFDFSFTLFHKILFSNDYWLLPIGSALTTIYPEVFFLDFGIKFFANAFFASIIVLLLGAAGLAFKKEKFFKL